MYTMSNRLRGGECKKRGERSGSGRDFEKGDKKLS